MPGPPFKFPYYYFRHDATQWINTNRPGWTEGDRSSTISTIWAGSAAVRLHYHRCKNIRNSPGLPTSNPIPNNPYTVVQAVVAKHTKVMPVQPAASGQPAAPQQSVAPVHSAAPVEDYVSRLPYSFWPQLPWPHEPELPAVNLKTIGKEPYTWLDTDPFLPSNEHETAWHGATLLGKGGYGATGLWVETNEQNEITDKMVIKETKPFHVMHWRDPKNWRDRLPREIRIHQLVEERRQANPEMCRHIIRFRNHRLLMQQRRYRLYLDICPGGDLWGAMEDHDANWTNKVSHNDGPDEYIEGRDDHNEESYLPIAFVWYVLRSLATACLVLRNGTTAEEPVEGWRPITHMDWQLPNVLLGIGNNTIDPSKEQVAGATGQAKGKEPATATIDTVSAIIPIVSDFGISFFSPVNQGCPISDNPEDYLIHREATPYPPEIQFQTGPPYTPLGEKTDVWGIGRIVWALIVNRQENDGPLRDHPVNEPARNPVTGKHVQKWPTPLDFIKLSEDNELNRQLHGRDRVLSGNKYYRAASCYPEVLKDLVRRCLNFRQTDRPTLREILDAANEALNEDLEMTMTDLADKPGLGLSLPDNDEFMLGKTFDLKKHRPQLFIFKRSNSDDSLYG